MDHRPRSHEGSQGDTPTASPSRDASSHSARNTSLRGMGVNPNNWNGQSSDQSASQGESSNLSQERYDYKKEDRETRKRLASELSKNYSELSNAKSSLAEARQKNLYAKKELERVEPMLKEATARKKELSKKYLKSRTEKTLENLKNANQTVTNLSKSRDSIIRGIKQSERDLNQYAENVKNLELKQEKLYKDLDNVKHDRHVLEFSGEEIYHLMEEKGFDNNTALLAWEALSHLRREENTRYKHLRNTEEYIKIYNILEGEFKPWQKQKNKEEASITQLLNRLREAVSSRKHSGQRENLSQPE